MFTPAFIKHYPTPWRIQGAEVADCHGDHVIAFEADTPEDLDFWENIVRSVNDAGALMAGAPDPVQDFLAEAADEIERAAMLHPDPNPNLAALTEEVGELAKALLEARVEWRRAGALDPEYWGNIREEAVQVAAMACRVAIEGDPTLEVVPE